MKIWHLGNTTVRSPFRLRDGLSAIASSPLQGDLRGREQEIALRNLLGEKGIVSLGSDPSYSVGRKWRSALGKLGFLYPELSTALDLQQSDLGTRDTITQNGRRLIYAESVPAMQECFLRALAAHYIPSVLEDGFQCGVFSPLRHTLAIMQKLEQKTGENSLNFIEMALTVQLSTGDEPVGDIVAQIMDLRARREKAPNKQRFDRQAYEAAAEIHGYVANTFKDYADTNFRYIKATGLVQSKGKGIALVPSKRIVITQLVQDVATPASPLAYYKELCNGAALPTDNYDSALAVLDDLLRQADERGVPFDHTGRPKNTPADIACIRHEIEEQLREMDEEEYATRQGSLWREIAAYMELLIERKSRKSLPDGTEIEVPKTETPAYLEWVLWRAFLAVDSLSNKPYEARRFKIDQDYLPIGTAPGNGPDLIFEFEDFVIVVEVTLTDGSRQEAAEGEPVRRHVADFVVKYREDPGKPVYGLFIANNINSNTAETFRIGAWYTPEDERMRLDIIPLTLQQFKVFFEMLFTHETPDVTLVRKLLEECGQSRATHEAPAWKNEIERVVREMTSS